MLKDKVTPPSERIEDPVMDTCVLCEMQVETPTAWRTQGIARSLI